MSDSSLISSITAVHHDSMVVLEDVDCCVAKRDGITVETIKPGQKNGDKEAEVLPFGVTLSGLLNELDGMQSPSGVMFFMTTNHIEKLDAALLRPGRTDVKEFFGPATEQQKLRLYRKFFPEDGEAVAMGFVQRFSSLNPDASMADFQEALMRERNQQGEPQRALAASAGD
jgi:chaperone BCS1